MKTDWQLFKGDGVPRRVEFPPAPPWRRFRTAARHRAESYRPTPEDVRIVNVALHLRRPLLVEGPPGSGKSSLASAVARELDLGAVLTWPVNSRTTLRDGLYLFDAVGRLNDLGRSGAGAGEPAAEDRVEKYLTLGPLGTALASADRPRVLLVDELDKGDGDLPNDLLHVLENGWFGIPELERVADRRPAVDVSVDPGDGGPSGVTARVAGGVVRASAFPVIVITSNGERDFPPAFLRRCVRHTMPDPERGRLEEIVRAHLGDAPAGGLIGQFLQRIEQGERLAIDQLLNAVFLLAGDRDIPAAERDKIADDLFRDLGK